MTIAIEQLELKELQAFLREQAEDSFPDLKDEERLTMLSEKWHSYAEICTCRNDIGQLVGMIAFYANQPDGRVAYIPHVYVKRELRGKSIFKMMFYEIVMFLKKNGFKRVRLEVNNNNLNARRAYSAMGFHIDGAAGAHSTFMVYFICDNDNVY